MKSCRTGRPNNRRMQEIFPSIAHSICISHTERLKAAATLYRVGLGNHAAPFVRIAYEENAWIYYLASIEDRKLRNELLIRMANLNMMQRVHAKHLLWRG